MPDRVRSGRDHLPIPTPNNVPGSAPSIAKGMATSAVDEPESLKARWTQERAPVASGRPQQIVPSLRAVRVDRPADRSAKNHIWVT
jgi:hypothetical protein